MWLFKPLTPVLAITDHDEPWPFFHFWRRHFWPQLASSILNLCRWKRSFQWYPEQSAQPNGTWDMHKNAQKVEWKTQRKISCHCTWLLHGKNCPSWWCSLRSFLAASKPIRRPITAAKRKEKGKKGRWKKKVEKPKILISTHAPAKMTVVKRDASGKTGLLPCCRCLFD